MERKKQRDKKRRNAKKHQRDKANKEYVIRKNAKKNERNKANQEYVARKNAKKNERHKAKIEYQEKKKARKNAKKNAKKEAKRISYSNRVVEYERILKNGHDRVCVCCGQLFSEIGIVVNSPQCILAIEENPQLINVKQISWVEELQLCITCSTTLAKGKVPKLCLANGLDFPPIPEELKGLSQLETSSGISSHTLHATERVATDDTIGHQRKYCQCSDRYRGIGKHSTEGIRPNIDHSIGVQASTPV